MMHRLKILILLFILPAIALHAGAATDSLNCIGKVNHTRGRLDTIPHSYIFNQFNWHVRITNPNSAPLVFETGNPDTLIFHTGDTVHLHADIRVATDVLNKIVAVKYNVNGSMQCTVNNIPVIATGIFCRKAHDRCSGFAHIDYTTLVFRDTNVHLAVDYVPMKIKKTFETGIEFGTREWGEKNQHDEMSAMHWDYAIGLYYLAFGVVFMFIFLFYKDRSENLYFALFCIFASLSKLTSASQVSYLLTDCSKYIFVFALEFLTFFLAKVLRNKDKSKVPLFVIIILSVIGIVSGNWNNLSFVLLGGGQLNILEGIIVAALYSYSVGSSLVYLAKGFGQKRWEAKTILFTCIIGLILNTILPGLLAAVFTARGDYSKLYYINIFAKAGLFLYPLSATIVLGRRTGLNQKQLIRQIQSIESLSKENLQKEQEKKQILEELNSSLEQKVMERTEEVMQQKDLIEVKNKALTENVTYSKRIQAAILPDIKLIRAQLKDSFVLYIPKDIVSGDFYFYAERNNKVIIIAGDCTGHGVSGALMSMVGSSLLHQLINEKGITEPEQILEHLNAAIIYTLNQDETESNDGMDIALCSFDFNSNTVEFSGANRPLWLIRNNEFTAVKPDKFPIGGLQMQQGRSFTRHTLALQPGDAIYIFSDGYADQFGGPNGKKMLSSKFREKLLGLQQIKMAEQGDILRKHFDDWKGSLDQVDDVLVIGIRV